MKKLLSFLLVGILVASFAIGAVATSVQAKPLPGVCYVMCNRTTYQLVECCPYDKHGEIDWHCHMIGWCYPG